MSTLKALGIVARVNLERVRKVAAKRTFEAHELMLRSYYAVRLISSSSQVDFSRITLGARLPLNTVFDFSLDKLGGV